MLLLFSGLLSWTAPSSASAASVGSGNCVQTVDLASNIVVVESNGLCFIAFKSGTRIWTPPIGIVNIDLLVVGGGGGGASRHAGGGGAGGLLQSTDVLINGSDVTIRVGAGGAGGPAQSTAGANASNGETTTVSGGGISTRNAIGGGGGSSNSTAGSGGSGGGGNCCTGLAGSGTAGQGNAGSVGATSNPTYWVGGGGGGAGGTGTTAAPTKAGSGGVGLAISWISTTVGGTLGVGASSSSQLFFAGGGGGGSDRDSIPGGDGGIGGGAPGSTGLAVATDGTANTGGGGGGSGISGVGTGSRKGGDGGSGVVVIRYAIPSAQFTANNYTAGSTTWANDISGGTVGTVPSGGMQKTSSGPSGVVFTGKESSNSDQLTSSIGSTANIDSVTVEMWVKLKDSGSAQNAFGSMLFSWDNGGPSYNIYHFQDQLGFNTFQSQLYGINSSSYNNVWTHLVFVMTDTGGWPSQKIYVNGVSQALTCRVGAACNNSDLRTFASNGNFVLMNHPNTADTWNAKSDLGLVRVYNRELSATAVQNIYNSTSASYFEAADTTAPTITGPSSATGATSSISIPETATAVHTFTANETVTWSKSGTDGSFFTISSGGALTITARNFESPADSDSNNTYVVVITATDTASNATNQTLTVTITNVNEAPTITINSSASNHTITQAENISTVATYTATDVDAATTLSWSLSGTDAADFAINSSSGALAFSSNPDFEAPADSDTNNSYIIIVTVSDGSLTDTQTVTITITNANESASINAPTVSGVVFKGVVETITVTINVAGKVRFFVGGKRISTCKDRTTSGTYPNNSATCLWRPPVTGRQILTATLTPTDTTFSASTSAPTTVQVVRRTNTR